MTDIKLSKRMKAVADMVAAGGTRCVADIGCDHAFVSIYLKSKGIAEKVIAMDVRKGPLDIAKENISAYGLSDYIDVRLSNGFDALEPGEADTAVIAGMGGPLMVDILKRGREHTDAGIRLVLQPQSEPDKLRQYLCDIGYLIDDEGFLQEDGKYYTVIQAVKADAIPDDVGYAKSQAELLYGPVLLRKKDSLLGQYIEESLRKNRELRDKLEASPTPKGIARIEELKREEKIMLCALSAIYVQKV
jgi:tRNA (adenine22-N1)-methyltransferase